MKKFKKPWGQTLGVWSGILIGGLTGIIIHLSDIIHPEKLAQILTLLLICIGIHFGGKYGKSHWQE